MSKYIPAVLSAFLFVVFVPASWSQLAADTSALGHSGSAQNLTLLQVLQKGGWAIYVLFGVSILSVVLICYNLFAIRRKTIITQKLLNAIDAYLHKGDLPGLVAYAAGENEVFARIVQQTLQFGTRNPGTRMSVLRDIAETEGSRQSSRLYQCVSYLYDIGVIAPMIGLAGTVTGMIMSFNVLGQVTDVTLRPSTLASGVAEALIATAAGLVVGTPSMIFYAIFKGRVQNLVSELEAATTNFLAQIETHFARASLSDTSISSARAPAQKTIAAYSETKSFSES